MKEILIALLIISLFLISVSVNTVSVSVQDVLELERRDNMEYQIMLEPDSIVVWDNQRYVGSVKYGNSSIDSLFMRDNE